MDRETKNHIEELHHRYAALNIVLTDAMALLASLAPEEFNDILRRHRMLVQAMENGTLQSGDRSLLEGHRSVRNLLEKAQERAFSQ